MRGFLVPIFIFTFTFACVSRTFPPTEDFAISYSLLEDARIGGGEIYAPDLMQEARFFYEQAERESAAGNYEKAEELRLISEIRTKTVISIGRNKAYEEDIERLQFEISEVNSTKKTHEADLRENVSKLEQIKDRIAVSQKITYSRALDMIEKALEKIEAAEDLSADEFSPELLEGANESYKAAEESFNLGKNEKSVEAAEKAIAFAERAYEESKNKSDLRDEMKGKLSSIYGAHVEPIKKGIKVIFQELFAPSGTTILFDAHPSLDALVSVLAEYPNLQVTVQANTNDLKSDDENFNLSLTRVEAVTVYLLSKGLSTERLKVGNFGFDKPLNDKVGVRRIEFVICLTDSGNI